MISIKDKTAKARTVSLQLPSTRVEPGKEATVAVSLATIPDIRPREMVTLMYLLIPYVEGYTLGLVHLRADGADLPLINFLQEPLEDEPELPPGYGVFQLYRMPMSPLHTIAVTMTNESKEARTLEGFLLCQVKPVMGVWFGQSNSDPNPKYKWIEKVAHRLTGIYMTWQEARKAKKEAQKRCSKENICCCYEETDDFEPVADSEPEIRRERLRDHLRLMAIDLVSVASFPFKAALHLTTKAMADLNKPSEPVSTGNFILDCGTLEVKAGESANVTVQCQVYFRPTALIIPPMVAGNFDIVDLKVGKNSQFLSARSVPAIAFAYPDGTPIPLKIDILRPGQFLTISVHNNADLNQRFTATLVGRSVGYSND
jgi:hypothetical protein